MWIDQGCIHQEGIHLERARAKGALAGPVGGAQIFQGSTKLRTVAVGGAAQVPRFLWPVNVQPAARQAFGRLDSREQSLGLAPFFSVGRHCFLKKKQLPPVVLRQAFLRMPAQVVVTPGTGSGWGSG